MLFTDVTNIMTKYLSIDILDKQSWNSVICLSKECLDEIAFWKRNLRTADLKEFTSDLSCHTIVYSDAEFVHRKQNVFYSRKLFPS
jgi:hypothetical protein